MNPIAHKKLLGSRVVSPHVILTRDACSYGFIFDTYTLVGLTCIKHRGICFSAACAPHSANALL